MSNLPIYEDHSELLTETGHAPDVDPKVRSHVPAARWLRMLRSPREKCGRMLLDRRARAHFKKCPPVFIVGAPRSGTTLLLQILSAQPFSTRSFEPFHTWERVMGRRRDDTFPGTPTLGQRVRLRTEFYTELEPGRPYLISKDPRDSLRINAIRHAFPTARFIHIVRDGRDTIASIIKAFEAGGTYHVEPGWAHVRIPGYRKMFDDPHHLKAARIWRTCVEAVVREFERVPPDLRTTIRYEDLLEQPEAEAKRMVAFVSPNYSRQALEDVLPLITKSVPPPGSEATRPFGRVWVKSEIADDAGSGTFSSSERMGKWQQELPDAVIRECQPILAPWLAHFGYCAPAKEE